MRYSQLRTVALQLFFLGGISALIYEVTWVRLLSLDFGVSVYAVSAVLTAFMAGLALGSWRFGRLAARLAPRPVPNRDLAGSMPVLRAAHIKGRRLFSDAIRMPFVVSPRCPAKGSGKQNPCIQGSWRQRVQCERASSRERL